jgi:hypothetical protein
VELKLELLKLSRESICAGFHFRVESFHRFVKETANPEVLELNDSKVLSKKALISPV